MEALVGWLVSWFCVCVCVFVCVTIQEISASNRISMLRILGYLTYQKTDHGLLNRTKPGVIQAGPGISD